MGKKTNEEIFKELETSENGLSESQVKDKLIKFGLNELEEKKSNPLLVFLSYFWGPIPWMIEIAAILSLIIKHWPDFIIIMVMLSLNAIIGFFQEHKASNALEALKNSMALKAKVKRDGKWQDIDAKSLVPGDIVNIKLGTIIPADIVLFAGKFLSVDQSALTGESLPVTKSIGDEVYSGSIAKKGDMEAIVTKTGANTYFGKTAKLVQEAGNESHFQKAVMKIGNFLIFLALGLSILIITKSLLYHQSPLALIEMVLILLVASIPVAMPAVLSVTMALGAVLLSKKKAIVSKLQAIEEIAGVDILCSDKTGTLTKNQLVLGEPIIFKVQSKEELILNAALASKGEASDAIDSAIISGLENKEILKNYTQTEFIPFDPVLKYTMASIKDGNKEYKVVKGAPQVVIDMCIEKEDVKKKAEKVVNDLALRGYRALGVAKKIDNWELLGIIPMYDPPRDDSKETIKKAKEHGILVKMATGDDLAIGKEISRQLGMGSNLLPAVYIFENEDPSNISQRKSITIEKADGFARVFPEHKYGIVKSLQKRQHYVAMTGDGVNDAPALKQADVGIAVSGATDAARAAADLILTKPGLSVIITAVEEARKIFERMQSYIIYRIAMTLDIMFFVTLAIVFFDFMPLSAIMIIMLALLDDIPIMAIAYDNAIAAKKPVSWNMKKSINISVILGLLSVVQSFVLMYFLKEKGYSLSENSAVFQSSIFLQLVVGGHLLLMVTRNKKMFFMPPFPSWKLFTAMLCTQIFAVSLVAFGWFVPKIGWKLIGFIWIYSLMWMVLLSFVRVIFEKVMNRKLSKFHQFFKIINKSLQHHPGLHNKKDSSRSKV